MTPSDRAWNAGRKAGQKKPFTIAHIQTLARYLEDNKAYRDLCLFCVGIDSSLRGGDLLNLKVGDVLDGRGYTKSELKTRQQKTGEIVIAALSPYTQSAINCYVIESGLGLDDYLFPSRITKQSITTNFLRRLVKQWALILDLDPSDYSSHSLRRSKPTHLYNRGVRPEMLRFLLGHKSLKSTQEYLGLDRSQALDLARQYDCFGEEI